MRSFTRASLGPATLAILVAAALVGCPKGQPMQGTTGASTGDADSTSSSTGPVVPTEPADPGTSTATGTDTSTSSGTGDDTSGGTSTGAPATTTSDTGRPGSASEVGSSSSGDATTGPPLRLFDCFGCSCDADTSFCRKVFVGVVPVDERPMCPIVEPGGVESGCVVYPPDCAARPSCDCLLPGNNDCFCNESERLPGAFEVTCPLP